ncbi:hypothetical protein HK098_003608 [Nowakowskiella sp. JEL0407]|nr:hypothetical protein HK098_003608 [Nowakowskiella sp. JEL0407]
MTRAVSLYIPHGGGPMPLIGADPSSKEIAEFFSTKVPTLLGLNSTTPPKAIVLVTAHWEENEVNISCGKSHELYFDYYGFPPETYKYKYPAPGDPEVAQRVNDVLKDAGIPSNLNLKRGWDHGVFVPMMLINPTANVPIVQMSLLSSLDPAKHIQIGKALAKLREENIAILGSGLSFHNMRAFFGGDNRGDSKAFDTALNAVVTNADTQEMEKMLTNWKTLPQALYCHPREEHLIPLMVVAGASAGERGQRVFQGSMAKQTYGAWQFAGDQRDEL